ncbi:hypothetical protein DICPUDRAFT_80955 [Dictyostelium purpureum]|uniref:Uncharacterized protein n=1 Tax=Dictyostelium purpureum TaxID=5786 RepID=F0ZS17_DICPU|nr:uncharacterized protein DICPUDRAFT_80955 [Dictyostelium purpureum]EGC33259.1 hypothetical protein DICPUDRAFT_80955 [Dictyostelium purpureum]|eukprot:XP_003290206.1 hypothetical protein DICPUDRAFT_80955 [Dictyostelium purpureum]
MDNTIRDANDEEIELLETSKVEKTLENSIQPYIGQPSDQVDDYDKYRANLIKKAKERKEWTEKYEREKRIKKGEIVPEPIPTTDDSDVTKETVLTENKIEYIICHIEDYNDIEAFIKITRDSSKHLTDFELLAIYTKAYQWMYKEEEISNGGDPGHIAGLMNRERSAGRFEIWGHDITDLIFNGCNEIKIYENFVYCDFGVDS